MRQLGRLRLLKAATTEESKMEQLAVPIALKLEMEKPRPLLNPRPQTKPKMALGQK